MKRKIIKIKVKIEQQFTAEDFKEFRVLVPSVVTAETVRRVLSVDQRREFLYTHMRKSFHSL